MTTPRLSTDDNLMSRAITPKNKSKSSKSTSSDDAAARSGAAEEGPGKSEGFSRVNPEEVNAPATDDVRLRASDYSPKIFLNRFVVWRRFSFASGVR